MPTLEIDKENIFHQQYRSKNYSLTASSHHLFLKIFTSDIFFSSISFFTSDEFEVIWHSDLNDIWQD